MFKRPIYLLARTIDPDSLDSKPDSDNEDCLKLFMNPAHRLSTASSLLSWNSASVMSAVSPSPAKKSKESSSSTKGKMCQVDDMTIDWLFKHWYVS